MWRFQSRPSHMSSFSVVIFMHVSIKWNNLFNLAGSSLAFFAFFVCRCVGYSDSKDAHTRTYVYTNTHKPHLQWEEVFEWQVAGMAVSDCGDNGILVSLQIVPQEMAENCFWIKVKEEKFENPDLFAQLSQCFSSQSKGKEASSACISSLINLHTRASFSLSGNRRQATFILWHFKKSFSSLKCSLS